MELNIFNVLRGPVITDKATLLSKKLKKIIFKVHKMANKPMIKKAIEAIFDVKVKNVRVLIHKGKKKMFKRTVFFDSDEKRAVISLKPEYEIDFTKAKKFTKDFSDNKNDLKTLESRINEQ